jgi:arginyl-tRNA synthetase
MIGKLKEIISLSLGLEAQEVSLELPEKENFGDYTTSLAMKAFGNSNLLSKLPQDLQKVSSPFDLASKIAEKLTVNKELMRFVQKIEVKNPGFINFWIKDDALFNNLISISKYKYDYGSSQIGEGKRVVIDYSSPNIAKRFSIGHLRSTIIGQALYNIYQFLGYKAIGDNHLGDWGTQFGKLIYMLRNYQIDSLDIDTLEKLYVKFHKLAENDKTGEMDFQARVWFSKLEKGDKIARLTWQKCRKISLDEFNRIYDLLGVSFDYMLGESHYESEIKDLLKDKKLRENLEEGENGAKIIRLDEFGIKTPLMFLKSDGATTYAARDLACLRYRIRRFQPHLIIYEVGQEQTLHFKQVFAAARKLGYVSDEVVLYHTRHGLYLSSSGSKFSTRKGDVVNLEEVLKQAIENARKIIESSATSRDLTKSEIERVANDVGIGAIKYFDLKHSVQSDIVFDWKKILSLEGNSGPYLQYTFARAFSVLKKAKEEGIDFEKETYISNLDFSSEERSIAKSVFDFGQVIEKSAFDFAPNVLCEYLFNLAQKYNSFYAKYPILKEKDLQKRFLRLKLTEATSWVLRNGLRLLGIEVIEKM